MSDSPRLPTPLSSYASPGLITASPIVPASPSTSAELEALEERSTADENPQPSMDGFVLHDVPRLPTPPSSFGPPGLKTQTSGINGTPRLTVAKLGNVEIPGEVEGPPEAEAEVSGEVDISSDPDAFQNADELQNVGTFVCTAHTMTHILHY
jgi:hypothetical protein